MRRSRWVSWAVDAPPELVSSTVGVRGCDTLGPELAARLRIDLGYAVTRAIAGLSITCYALPSRTGGPEGIPVKGGHLAQGVVFRSRGAAETPCSEECRHLAPDSPPRGPDEADVDLDLREWVELDDDLDLSPA